MLKFKVKVRPLATLIEPPLSVVPFSEILPVLVWVEDNAPVRLSAPPYNVIGPFMEVAAPMAIFAVLVDLPIVSPVNEFGKLRYSVFTDALNSSLYGLITTVPEVEISVGFVPSKVMQSTSKMIFEVLFVTKVPSAPNSTVPGTLEG